MAESKKAFTADERAAMRERAKERKAAKGDGEGDVLAKIAEMQGSDRALAERVHAIVTASAPALSPRTWYGMPAYALKELTAAGEAKIKKLVKTAVAEG